MSMRITETHVTFMYPFSITSVDQPQAPGRYRLVIDDEEIHGPGFVTLRRVALMIDLPMVADRAEHMTLFAIDPLELAHALLADQSPHREIAGAI
jgi:hypothetical protein